MRRRLACTLAALAIFGACNRAPKTKSAGEVVWISGGRIKAEVFHSASIGEHPRLIAILHGDLLESAGEPYHAIFARRAANQMSDVVAAAILRPGYRDGAGDESKGRRGFATGDNYTPEVIDAIAQGLGELKTKYAASGITLVGHSGGAAIAADLIGRYRLADRAMLVSCPCDLERWRKHMSQVRFGPLSPARYLFRMPVKSLSPIGQVAGIEQSLQVRMIVGSADPVAPPAFSEEYANALRKRGIGVKLTILPALGHEILLDPAVLGELKSF